MRNDIHDFNAVYEQQLAKALEEKDIPQEIYEKYYITECLSVSHTSEVYLIKDKMTNQKYVLKIIKSSTAKEELYEESLLRILDHKDIPKLIEHYSNGQYQFIVKTYFYGHSLYDYNMLHGVFSIEEVFHITEQLLDIISYLHSQDPPIIYRDIKPHNIIYTPAKEVKLIDFDIARQFRHQERYDTIYLGTREYAPPEQFGFSQTDQRTDIYSIGMLMFFMLTGHIKVENIDVHIKDVKIKKIIEKCIAFAPKDRYSSVKQLKKAIYNLNSQRNKVMSYVRVILLSILAVTLGIMISSVWPTKQTPASNNNQIVENTSSAEEEGVNTQDTYETIEDKNDQAITDNMQIINFPDKGLEKAIREVINKPSGDILISDVQAVTSLESMSNSIESLEGIQYLTNLTLLGLWENNIEDISPLENLIHLQYLFLDGNEISDLTPLSGLNGVISLGLGGNYIEDISPLSSLPHLIDLNLSNNAISDLSPLVSLEQLKRLDICGDNNITDYTPLKKLPNLKELEVDGQEDFNDFDVLE